MNHPQTEQSPLRVLIVDDQPADIGLLRKMLEPQGYEIFVAPTGAFALQIAHQAKPDLILLDIIMPEIDGFEVCRRLKADKTTADISIIFITAKHDPESVVEGFQVGGVDYITKPFYDKEVLMRVQTHLKNARLTQELIRKNRELQEAIDQRQQVEAALQKADEQLSMISQQEVERWGIAGFVGQSSTIAATLDDVRKLHQHAGAINVLIIGESGTGKELIARAIHISPTCGCQNNNRRGCPTRS